MQGAASLVISAFITADNTRSERSGRDELWCRSSHIGVLLTFNAQSKL